MTRSTRRHGRIISMAKRPAIDMPCALWGGTMTILPRISPKSHRETVHGSPRTAGDLRRTSYPAGLWLRMVRPKTRTAETGELSTRTACTQDTFIFPTTTQVLTLPKALILTCVKTMIRRTRCSWITCPPLRVSGYTKIRTLSGARMSLRWIRTCVSMRWQHASRRDSKCP